MDYLLAVGEQGGDQRNRENHAKILAEKHGRSAETIRNYGKLAEQVDTLSETTQTAFRNSEIDIRITDVNRLADLSFADQDSVISSLKDDQYQNVQEAISKLVPPSPPPNKPPAVSKAKGPKQPNTVDDNDGKTDPIEPPDEEHSNGNTNKIEAVEPLVEYDAIEKLRRFVNQLYYDQQCGETANAIAVALEVVASDWCREHRIVQEN